MIFMTSSMDYSGRSKIAFFEEVIQTLEVLKTMSLEFTTSYCLDETVQQVGMNLLNYTRPSFIEKVLYCDIDRIREIRTLALKSYNIQEITDKKRSATEHFRLLFNNPKIAGELEEFKTLTRLLREKIDSVGVQSPTPHEIELLPELWESILSMTDFKSFKAFTLTDKIFNTTFHKTKVRFELAKKLGVPDVTFQNVEEALKLFKQNLKWGDYIHLNRPNPYLIDERFKKILDDRKLFQLSIDNLTEDEMLLLSKCNHAYDLHLLQIPLANFVGVDFLPIPNIWALMDVPSFVRDLIVQHKPDLVKITSLELNGMFSLPQEISVCSSLEVLDLSGMRSTNFPEAIGQLPSLKKLVLNNTHFKEVPIAIIQNLQILEELFIDQNVGSLDFLAALPNLKILTLKSTTLNPVPVLSKEAITFLRKNQVQIHSGFIMNSLLSLGCRSPWIHIDDYSENIKKCFYSIWADNFNSYDLHFYFSIDEIIGLENYIRESSKIAEWCELARKQNILVELPINFPSYQAMVDFTARFPIENPKLFEKE